MGLSNLFDGKWTYRSFHNDPDLATEFNKLRFGAGNLELVVTDEGSVSGSLGGTGWSLALSGYTQFGSPNTIRFQGKGTISSELWVYDYLGWLAPMWPNGVDQRPAIVGTIVRTASHSAGQSPAGYTASWIAVRV